MFDDTHGAHAHADVLGATTPVVPAGRSDRLIEIANPRRARRRTRW
jgi:hypothetical protein